MPCRYIFIEFNTPEEAERARMAMDKHPFDARHRFQINILSDIETFKDMDETYEDPEPEEFKPRVGSFPLLLGAFWAIMCVYTLYRSIFVLGLAILKGGTNTSYFNATMSLSIGTANLRQQR
jgi:hypothetical protein